MSTYTTALDTYFSSYSQLKTDIRTEVLETFGVDLSTDFLKYGEKISQLPGIAPDVIKQAMTLSPVENEYTTSDDVPLKTISKSSIISSNFIKELEISSFEKFKFWFLDTTTDISFPNLSAIRYGENITEEEKQYIEAKLKINANADAGE